MKKSSKILGSLAVSAALVMGTAVPAFADTVEGQDNQGEVGSAATHDKLAAGGTQANKANSTYEGQDSAKGASTVVNVSTYTSQISVTVPLSLPVTLDTAGGVGYGPSAGAYYIQNNSTIPVKVTKADYTISKAKGADWVFGPENGYVAGGSRDAAAINNATDTTNNNKAPEIGGLWVKLTPLAADDTDGTKLMSGAAALQLKAADDGANQIGSATFTWTLPAKGETDPGTAENAGTGDNKIKFKIDAESSTLKKSIDFDAQTPVTAAGIIYTVSK